MPLRTHRVLQSLPDMAVFAMVVECAGFSAAARQLALTPSAVSRQVARLEAQLGVKLLERTTRRLRLSESGGEVYAHCREMLAAAQATLEAAEGYMEAPRGLVRVSVPKAFARLVLHPLIPGFLSKYPDVDVKLFVTDSEVDPITDDVDLVVRITDRPPGGFAARPLVRARHVLCATPKYLARHGTPTDPHELAQHSCLYLGERAGDDRWRLRRGGETVSVTVRGRYAANHSEIRLDAVLSHLGIGCVPEFTAERALKAGRVVEVLPDWELLAAYRGTAYVLYPPNRRLAPKLRVFIDHLAESLHP